MTDPIRPMFGTPALGVPANGAQDAFIGQSINDLAAGTQDFPTAVTGYSEMHSPGGQGFGVFGRADLFVNGVAMNEFDSFNHIGVPLGQFPPNLSFGTPDNLSISVLHAAYGEFPSAIADMVALGSQPFLCGYYIEAASVTLHGIFVDADAAHGPNVSAKLRNTGSGINLVLETKGPAAPNNAVMVHYDQAGNVKSAIKQSGDIWGRLLCPASFTVAGLPANPGLIAFAFATNGRKPSETAGHGTGVPVFWDGAHWISFCSGSQVQA
jgi:hypothetical protein